MRIVRSRAVMAILLALCWNGVEAQTGLVKLDRVSATVPGDNRLLMSGQIHQAYIRYDLRDCASGYWSTDNGFEIYSPDGANWGYFKGADGPLVAGLREGVQHYDTHWYRSASGNWTPTGNSGEDSASCIDEWGMRGGYRLAIIDPNFVFGLRGGVDNDVALVLEFMSRDIDNGRTICLDTVRSFHAGGWGWNRPGQTDQPQWDNGLGVSGPRCWEIYELPCAPGEPARERTKLGASETACEYCCEMRVGNANGSDEEMPTLADVMTMVNAKFISGSCSGVIACLEEADINKSGVGLATCDDITLGDIMMLVDYLFITGPENSTLPVCY